jgi:hypothetical protein
LLSFDQYQLLSFTGIQRLWVIQFLTQNFLKIQRQEWMSDDADLTLGDVVRRIREEFFGQIVVYVYQQALEKSLFSTFCVISSFQPKSLFRLSRYKSAL